MSVQNIGIEQTGIIPDSAVRAAAAAPAPVRTTLRSAPTSGASEYVITLHGGSSDFAQILSGKVDMNAAAERIRTESESLTKANEYVAKMKASLGEIVKQFPPYPPGSEDRVRLLMSYSSFRALISRLTYPPPDKGNGVPDAGQSASVQDAKAAG